MKVSLNRKNVDVGTAWPIKIVQFGEGNFLRAFVDYAFQELNKAVGFNGGIAVVQPINAGMVSMLNDQDGLYTLFIKGIKAGEIIEEKHLISNLVKGINPYPDFQLYLDLAKEDELEFIISNTTEAGISYDEGDTVDMNPPNSFPAKLLRLLYERYLYFNGDKLKGLTIIPCELINYNADTLKDILLKYTDDWKLGQDFKSWLVDANTFHNTLVDRIVPGYPRDNIEEYNNQLDYKDQLIVSAESFFLWVIEGDEKLKEKLPFHKTNLDVKIVQDMQPYRTRKVRILNGAHTSMVPFSILYGNETVKETVDNSFTGKIVESLIFDEIIPTLTLPEDELKSFANEVLDRFRNPFIKHQLSSIALNSISKFKVRVLPSLLEFNQKEGKLPLNLVFAFACLIRFYKGEWNGATLPLNDDKSIEEYFKTIWSSNDIKGVVDNILQKSDFWGEDLSTVPGLKEALTQALQFIEAKGVEEGYKAFVQS
ncbi:tagaturonate reductase [Aegicerativicinus sediminis]